MLVVDASGSIVFASQQVSVMFGYSSADLIGQPVERLLPERLRTDNVLHRAEYSSHPRVRPMGVGLDLYGRRQDGSEFPIEVSFGPLAEADSTLILAAVRDVTGRKSVEAALIEAHRAAERANQAKSRFLATASHDLRQPLQVLALLNGGLRRMTRAADAAEAVLQQERAIGAMMRLLDALLDISKLESGAVNPDPTEFAVATLFEELRAEFASLAANKGLQLQVEPSDAFAFSDPSLVGQILRNLLSNAIKYTREGWVRLHCPEQSACVRIEVLDTGLGIPPEHLAHIYDEFYQVGGMGRGPDGYGLGLSIVDRLVRLLALRLDVRSEVGRGSAFSLVLPAVARSERASSGARASAAGMQLSFAKGRVLLIEDEPAVRLATRMLLELEGYEVSATGSLAEALQSVRRDRQVDVIIADYHLADGETGIRAIAAVRDTLGSARKAVLMSGDTSSAVKGLGVDAGLLTVSKPVNAEEFLGRLEAFLSCESPSDREARAG